MTDGRGAVCVAPEKLAAPQLALSSLSDEIMEPISPGIRRLYSGRFDDVEQFCRDSQTDPFCSSADPFCSSAEVVDELASGGHWSELNDRFYKTLAFGTIALRPKS